MKRLLTAFLFFITCNTYSQEFQLAPPMLKYNSVFFVNTDTFSVAFNQPGTEVRYTLNGDEPTEKDLLYTTPVAISKRTVVKLRAIGKNYLPSETISTEFIKGKDAIKSIQYSKPGDSYSYAKPDILNDHIGGMTTNRFNTWLGYETDTVEVSIELKKKQKIDSVLINLLRDENGWIFLPEKIDLFYYNQKQNTYVACASQRFSSDKFAPKECIPQVIKPNKNITTSKLKLVLFTLKKIPEWHNAKGSHGWLFIDEIIVY
jgi:hypothetical protein